jgi:hypothetical protein
MTPSKIASITNVDEPLSAVIAGSVAGVLLLIVAVSAIFAFVTCRRQRSAATAVQPIAVQPIEQQQRQKSESVYGQVPPSNYDRGDIPALRNDSNYDRGDILILN